MTAQIEPAHVALLSTWQEASTLLGIARQREAAARQAVIAGFFATELAHSHDGTARKPLLNGYQLKATFKTNYSVGKTVLPDVLLELTSLGTAGQHAAETVFTYKPELSLRAYKTLMPSVRLIVDKAVTATPGMPALEIIAPALTPATAIA